MCRSLNEKIKNMTNLPFNSWSRERILQGRKSCTSRHRLYDDPLVTHTVHLTWEWIKRFHWEAEGADSPEELQQVIEKIMRRKVPDDELFFVHFFDNKKMQERLNDANANHTVR